MDEDFEDLNYDNIIPRLLARVPEFESIYEDHLIFNDELLPHVLMADFTWFALDSLQRSLSDLPGADLHARIVERSLTFLEHAMGVDDDQVQNVIAASFVETLLPDSDDDRPLYEAMKRRLGPRLLASLRFMDPY